MNACASGGALSVTTTSTLRLDAWAAGASARPKTAAAMRRPRFRSGMVRAWRKAPCRHTADERGGARSPLSRRYVWELTPGWRGGQKRLGRDIAQDELVVAKERGRQRRDRARAVERRQLPFLDRDLDLLDELLCDLPLRLDRRPEVGWLHHRELVHERRCDRCRHEQPPLKSDNGAIGRYERGIAGRVGAEPGSAWSRGSRFLRILRRKRLGDRQQLVSTARRVNRREIA